MLKKEKKKSQNAVLQLADITNGQSQATSVALQSSAPSPPEQGSRETFLAHHGIPAAQRWIKGPELSMGKQEAFEIFRRDHEDGLTIEDNKALLKQRYSEAKSLGEQVNEAKSRINELKKKLELHVMQRAVQGVTGNLAEKEDDDPVEERLRGQIKEEIRKYKTTFNSLKALKTEIEHLQLLLERSKVKLQRDFQEWWSQEVSDLQSPESDTTATRLITERTNISLPPSLPSTSGIGAPSLSSTVRDLPARRQLDTAAPSPLDLRNFVPKRSPTNTALPSPHDQDSAPVPSSQLRALITTEMTASSIPLTGDQQTDADILAFIRARQNLLSRPGAQP